MRIGGYFREIRHRDARAASVMRPWTLDIVTEEIWNAALGGNRDEGG